MPNILQKSLALVIIFEEIPNKLFYRWSDIHANIHSQMIRLYKLIIFSKWNALGFSTVWRVAIREYYRFEILKWLNVNVMILTKYVV